MFRTVGLLIFVFALLLPFFQSSAQQVEIESEVENEAVEVGKGARLYQRVDDIFKRRGRKAANDTFDDLSNKEKRQLKRAMRKGEVSIERSNDKPPKDVKLQSIIFSEQAATGVVCNEGKTYTVTNAVGPVVYYQFSQYIEWCGSPDKGITEMKCTAWPHDTGWGWQFQDFIPSEKMCITFSGGYGEDHMTMQSQAKFQPCLPAGDFGCFPSETPWIRQRGLSDGETVTPSFGR